MPFPTGRMEAELHTADLKNDNLFGKQGYPCFHAAFCGMKSFKEECFNETVTGNTPI